jgi:hypothetical protein
MSSITALSQIQPSSGSTALKGCLAGSDGQYTLVDQTGKSYVLSGKTDDLASHVGHQMELNGQGVEASNSSTDATGTPSPSRAAATFEVSSSRMVSNECPTGAVNSSGGSSPSVAVGTWDNGTTSVPATDQNAASSSPSTTSSAADETSQATPPATADGPNAAAEPVPDTSASPAQAADAANPETAAEQPQPTVTAANRKELPETGSQLPLYGILAIGFLCAGYMTLRTN